MHLSLPNIDFSAVLPVIASAAPTAIAIMVAAVAITYGMRRALFAIAHRTHFTDTEVGPIYRALKWVILISSVVLVLGAFGVNMGGVWGVMSTLFAMIAIGFVAVWSVLSNALCTLMIMVFRPFGIGDDIEFPGEQVKGRVTDLNFMFTTLDAGEGYVIEVPNNLFFQRSLRRKRAAQAVTPAAHLRTRKPAPERDGGKPRPTGTHPKRRASAVGK